MLSPQCPLSSAKTIVMAMDQRSVADLHRPQSPGSTCARDGSARPSQPRPSCSILSTLDRSGGGPKAVLANQAEARMQVLSGVLLGGLLGSVRRASLPGLDPVLNCDRYSRELDVIEGGPALRWNVTQFRKVDVIQLVWSLELIDGSASSRAVLAFALVDAGCRDAEIQAVSVVHTPESLSGGPVRALQAAA